MRILIVSVGGSCEPVINAIKEYRPGYVYFLCSAGANGSKIAVDGPGNPCGDKRKTVCPGCGADVALGKAGGKSIVIQTGLKTGEYEKVLVESPDDLDDCYRKVTELAAALPEKHPGIQQIIANYTGGTKTMSVALALVGALTERWDLSVNIGARLDLIKVASGTDAPIIVNKWKIFNDVQLEAVRTCLSRFDYAGAYDILAQLSSRPAEKEIRDKLLRARQVARSFDLWDKFDHGGALAPLEVAGKDFSSYIIALKKILGRISRASGCERVADLQLNAERRATQGRYDDAVARLYRALELFAQIRLKDLHGLDSGNLKLGDLPEHLQSEYQTRVKEEDGKLFLGLTEDYELLWRLEDPVGSVYDQKRLEVLNAIKARNLSIGAHGLIPLGERDFVMIRDTVSGFLEQAAAAINLTMEYQQLPGGEILGLIGLQ